MYIPNASQAIIDSRKLSEYCLNFEHKRGKNKAFVFQERLGLTREHTDMLIDALRTAIQTNEAELGLKDSYGQRYYMDFIVTGPKSPAVIRSIWIIRTHENFPRFVSCYVK